MQGDSSMYKIYIVEDDATIAGTLKEHLEKWDYKVRCAKDFRNITEEFAGFSPELVVMDILLPFYNGYHWCTEIRKISKVPILFLSSGGDDFVEKPFDLNVLTAKIQAMLRRAYSFQGRVNLIEHDGVILNLNDTCVSFEGKKLELTKNDFRIMQVLMENAGRIVKRDELMQRLWESDEFIDDNTLTVNVTRLRRKLEEIGIRDLIKTKKGSGYLIQ